MEKAHYVGVDGKTFETLEAENEGKILGSA
jgi:hypothetical protein